MKFHDIYNKAREEIDKLKVENSKESISDLPFFAFLIFYQILFQRRRI